MGMKISVELSHVCPLGEIPEHGAAIESLGFYRAWVPDTLVSQWDAWLAADLLAHHTASLRIGLGVTNPYTRHPMVMAQMAATLQAVSGGRLALSIGKGIARLLDKAGIRQHAGAVVESIAIMRKLIAGERVDFQGAFFHIDGIRLRTKPPEKPVPIYLAAIGPDSWTSARDAADGVATIWSDGTAALMRGALAENPMPVAALVPFSVSKEAFFPNTAGSIEALAETAAAVHAAGVDEVIIAYRDLHDLAPAAEIIRNFSL